MRYAFFPESRRLAIDDGGRITVYDTGDHRLERLFAAAVGRPVAELHQPARPGADRRSRGGARRAARLAPAAAEDVFGKIERLAELHARGILTAQEFEAKKADLLGRL